MKLFPNLYPDDSVDWPRQVFRPEQLRTMTGRRLIYVVTEDGTLIIGRRSRGPGGGHIDLAGGKPVRAAGEVHVVAGEIRSVNNASGHYQARGSGARDEAEQAFERAGFDIHGKYHERYIL